MKDIEDKDMTGNSRSFGEDYTKREIKEAVAEFCTNASREMRQQNSVCFAIRAFIQTNPFKDVPQHFDKGLF